MKTNALCKVSVFGIIMVRIFPHSDWILRDNPYLLYSVLMRENTDHSNSEYGHFLRSDDEFNTQVCFLVFSTKNSWSRERQKLLLHLYCNISRKITWSSITTKRSYFSRFKDLSNLCTAIEYMEWFTEWTLHKKSFPLRISSVNMTK